MDRIDPCKCPVCGDDLRVNKDEETGRDVGDWCWGCGYNTIDGEVHPRSTKLLLARLEDAEGVIEAAGMCVDEEPCRLDHHGYCQAHSLNKPCEVEEYHIALAAYNEKHRKGKP